MEHFFDVSIVLDTIQGAGTKDKGLGDFLGTLQVRRNSSPFTVRADPALAKLFVFWRGRRRYHVEEAHSAPEANEVKSFESGKKLAACAPSPSGTHPALEF